jgi:hypothetical protein
LSHAIKPLSITSLSSPQGENNMKSLTLPLSALLLALAGCGGGGGEAQPETPPEGRAVALAVSRPGELAAYVQERLRTLDRQGLLGLNTAFADGVPTIGMAAPASPGSPPASRTLVQEDGVDEPDLIQTDGRALYTLQAPYNGAGTLLHVHQRGSDGRAQRLATLPLAHDNATSAIPQGMVLNADQRALAVVSQVNSSAPAVELCPDCLVPGTSIVPGWMRSSVMVQRVDVSDPGNAAAGERIDIDGRLVDSRRIGNRLYVVTQHRPTLPVELLPAGSTAELRQRSIAAITASHLLPRMRRNGGAAQPLLADTDCYLQAGNGSTSVQLTTVTVFDLASTTLTPTSRCFVGGSEAVYMTAGALYLATTRWDIGGDAVIQIFPPQMRTDIHKFALEGGTVAYRASGQVPGHLGWDRERKSFRLGEHNGDLRVLSFTGDRGWFGTPDAATQTAAPSPATLSVLRENAGALQTVATLPNSRRPAAIGKPGEQVYAVRFAGDRGYVVTFRRTDPLYVLDLSDPADPKTVGELEIAGFSNDLFPLPNGLLLGVGKDADADGRVLGVKVALFDVSDPAAPSQRGSLVFGTTGSASALDFSRHGLNLMMSGSTARAALPVMLTSSPYAGWQRGLQRMEIDTAARTLSAKPLIPFAGDASLYAPLWQERAAQIGEHVYYMTGGNLSSHDW